MNPLVSLFVIPMYEAADYSGHTYKHTYIHTWDNYSNPRCAHARRGLMIINCFQIQMLILLLLKHATKSARLEAWCMTHKECKAGGLVHDPQRVYTGLEAWCMTHIECRAGGLVYDPHRVQSAGLEAWCMTHKECRAGGLVQDPHRVQGLYAWCMIHIECKGWRPEIIWRIGITHY